MSKLGFIKYGDWFYTDEEIQDVSELDSLVEQNAEALWDLQSYDSMVDLIVEKLKSGDLHWAKHLCDALFDEVAEYYRYDVSSGTIMTPRPVDTVADLKTEYPEVFKEETA